MVREENGGVRMWETSTGDDVLLPGRWRPQVDALGRPVEKKGAKGAAEKEAAVGAEEEAEGKKKKRGFGFGRKQKVGDSSLGGGSLRRTQRSRTSLLWRRPWRRGRW